MSSTGSSPQTLFALAFYVLYQQVATCDSESGSLSFQRGSFKATCCSAHRSRLEGHLDHMLLTASAASESERGNKGPRWSLLLNAQQKLPRAVQERSHSWEHTALWQILSGTSPATKIHTITSLDTSLLMMTWKRSMLQGELSNLSDNRFSSPLTDRQ